MHDYLFALVRAPITQNTVWYDSCPILYVVCMMFGSNDLCIVILCVVTFLHFPTTNPKSAKNSPFYRKSTMLLETNSYCPPMKL